MSASAVTWDPLASRPSEDAVWFGHSDGPEPFHLLLLPLVLAAHEIGTTDQNRLISQMTTTICCFSLAAREIGTMDQSRLISQLTATICFFSRPLQAFSPKHLNFPSQSSTSGNVTLED